MRSCVLTIILLSLLAVPATAATYWVPSTADLYLAGQPEGTVMSFTWWDNTPGASDTVSDNAAFETGFAVNPGTNLTFNAGGILGWTGEGADGIVGELASLYAASGGRWLSTYAHIPVLQNISPSPLSLGGYTNMPRYALMGVFTSDTIPALGSASSLPASLDFSAIGLNFASLSPELSQVFFIGDGRTSGGAAQSFRVPTGATRLFLGLNDCPGGYSTKTVGDGLAVSVQAVPEPSSLLVLISGIGGLGVSLRRRRR
jgi:hypothetical protein